MMSTTVLRYLGDKIAMAFEIFLYSLRNDFSRDHSLVSPYFLQSRGLLPL